MNMMIVVKAPCIFTFVDIPVPVRLDAEPDELVHKAFTLDLALLNTKKMTIGMSVDIVAFFAEPTDPSEVRRSDT